MKQAAYLLLFVFIFSCETSVEKVVQIEGELLRWHKVTFLIRGPETSEFAEENPFLDYKLDVIFTKGSKSMKVPGYFAADGNAGETSAKAGNVWKIHFRPDEAGTWNYEVSFKHAKNIAVIGDDSQGEAVSIDGAKGTLEVGESDKTHPDFRAGGRIINGGKGYLNQQGTNEVWIKNGVDSPENFLAYADFDQTSRFSLKQVVREGEANAAAELHKYKNHVADWNDGDPVWKQVKGKGIIGAVNYLQASGVNSVYMLTMNIIGDGKDVWPYSDYSERVRFDCSKLDQWEVVFDHMEQKGIMAHFVLQETENECLLDMGYTGLQRRVYLRELIARFGHHLAVTWNLGEENGPTEWSPIGQTDAQKKEMAAFLKETNPYPSIVALHTHSDDGHQDAYLNPMLAFKYLDGPSLQVGEPAKVHKRILKWVSESEAAGKRWIVNLDEIGPAWKGVMPDSHDTDHDTVRNQCLWGTLMAGGAGVEWYFGYRFPHNDLNCEDFRSRDNWLRQSTIATRFISQYPLEEMVNMDDRLKVDGGYCLGKPGEIYIVYLPGRMINAKLQVDGNAAFNVSWFNPRSGGDLMDGDSVRSNIGGDLDPGVPPSDPEKDWVAVITAEASK